MAKTKSEFIFNMIAPVYGLFYNWQKQRTRQVIDAAKSTLDLFEYKTILDVGCGTGAVCAVLAEKGFEVTGIDQAEGMLDVARRKAGGRPIRFVTGNVLEKLPFEDKTFDVSIASYVAHGLGPKEREIMYLEMSHPGEAATLLAESIPAVQADRVSAARALSRHFNAHVALKGNGSILAARDGHWFINTTGNPGMASAGMGDVLAGMLGALLAQRYAGESALVLGTHLHGAAADELARLGVGPVGMAASELIEPARRLWNSWLSA